MTRFALMFAAGICLACIEDPTADAPLPDDTRHQDAGQLADAAHDVDVALDSGAAVTDMIVPDMMAPDVTTPDATVPATPRWSPEAMIQDSIVAAPLDVVCVDATDYLPAEVVDGQGWDFEWRVTEQPARAGTMMTERFQDPRRPRDTGIPDDVSTTRACMFVPSVGEYLIELGVRDRIAHATVVAAQVRVLAASPAGIHIELTWETPSDPDQTDGDGTDVDLHVRHPEGFQWALAPNDCYYANAAPDWGQPGPPGNPSLDIDDVNGAGPEHINLDTPEDTQVLGGHYIIGVDYYRAEDFARGGTWGPSTVTIRVFLDGALAYEGQREMLATHHFWEVAAIEWIDGVGRVIEINEYFGQVPDLP